MQEYYGVVPCTLMSMLSSDLMPSACQTGIYLGWGVHHHQ